MLLMVGLVSRMDVRMILLVDVVFGGDLVCFARAECLVYRVVVVLMFMSIVMVVVLYNGFLVVLVGYCCFVKLVYVWVGFVFLLFVLVGALFAAYRVDFGCFNWFVFDDWCWLCSRFWRDGTIFVGKFNVG